MKTSFLSELLDLISPRQCEVCNNRLAPDEPLLCASCMKELPVTPFRETPYDNDMARHFWGQFPIEKASAWVFFNSHSYISSLVYEPKYHGKREQGEIIGELMAQYHQPFHFFDDIDVIIPLPISTKRSWQRGYNQSNLLAHGISLRTGITVDNEVVKRNTFVKSQTHLSPTERRENVRDAFQLINKERIKGKHLLLVDDVVTTGATIIACAQELAKAEGVRISVLSVGFTKD